MTVIEMVLHGRLGRGPAQTWRRIGMETGASLRSLRRWYAAFVMNGPSNGHFALRWLSVVWTVLAVAMPGAPMLDVHGAMGNVAQQLLSSSVELAGWLNANHPADAALRVMWCWGWMAPRRATYTGIGRLI